MSSKITKHDFVYFGTSAENTENYRVARRLAKSLTGESQIPQDQIKTFLTQEGDAGSDIAGDALKILNSKLLKIISNIEDSGLKNSKQKRRAFDIEAAPLIFQTLNGLPFQILNDMKFWRYVGVHAIYDVVDWRYPKDNGSRWGSNPTQSIRTLAYALFVRGQLCEGFDKNELALVNKVGDVDVWTSHVIAVLHGSSTAITHEFFRKCVGWQKPKGGFDDWGRLALRDLAKQLKALRSNYVFDVIDKRTAAQIVDRLSIISEQNATTQIDRKKDSNSEEDDE